MALDPAGPTLLGTSGGGELLGRGRGRGGGRLVARGVGLGVVPRLAALVGGVATGSSGRGLGGGLRLE